MSSGEDKGGKKEILEIKYLIPLLMKEMWTSGQDGGIGRYTLLPCTSKRRTTTNLKTKIIRTARKFNCMEI